MRDLISSGKWGTEKDDWVKTKGKYFLTKRFFEEVISLLSCKNSPNNKQPINEQLPQL